MHFIFAEMLIRQRPHLAAEQHIPARTSVTAVLVALCGSSSPHADEWKDAGPELSMKVDMGALLQLLVSPSSADPWGLRGSMHLVLSPALLEG